jgi:hypothetical protein
VFWKRTGIAHGSDRTYTQKEKGLCIIDLGSIKSPKSQFDYEIRNILDWEVVEPQEGTGVASSGIRAIIFLADNRQRERW